MAGLKKMKQEAALLAIKVIHNRGGFGLNEFLGIAAAIIVAGFIIIPGLKEFAEGIMENLGDWWDGMSTNIFSDTGITTPN